MDHPAFRRLVFESSLIFSANSSNSTALRVYREHKTQVIINCAEANTQAQVIEPNAFSFSTFEYEVMIGRTK